MKTETPAWGIEPVPDRFRVLGFADSALLWGNLGVSLLVLVAAAFLVPALSLQDALIAIVAGSLIGNLMLGAAGMIGADARVPGMVVLGAPLGQRGSCGPTALNVAQLLGWATFELIIIAAAAAALSDELFGFEARSVWTLVFGAVAALLAFMGPVGVVRRVIRKFAVWVVLGSLVYLTWWSLAETSLGALWDRPAEGGVSVWLGLALLSVTVDETDEAFANIYSTAVSLQNLVPEVPQRLLVAAVSVLATIGALAIELRNYETFLLLLGSFFVPLFGVLFADWLLAGARYTADDVFRSPAFRPGLIAAWILGFLLYHWLHVPPLGPTWWVDLVERVGQPDWNYGASLPSFLAAFCLGALAVLLERRGAPARLRLGS